MKIIHDRGQIHDDPGMCIPSRITLTAESEEEEADLTRLVTNFFVDGYSNDPMTGRSFSVTLNCDSRKPAIDMRTKK